MSTNANVFNSRVTSEALEAKYRQVFPAQAGAELIQDLYASGVIQPVIDFSSVAEGTVLPAELQQAWDFSTGFTSKTGGGSTTIISTPGFWLVDLVATAVAGSASPENCSIRLSDGITTKNVWRMTQIAVGSQTADITQSEKFVVFVRSGDSVTANTSNASFVIDVWYRQIADVNGTLVNPLGFTFQ